MKRNKLLLIGLMALVAMSTMLVFPASAQELLDEKPAGCDAIWWSTSKDGIRIAAGRVYVDGYARSYYETQNHYIITYDGTVTITPAGTVNFGVVGGKITYYQWTWVGNLPATTWAVIGGIGYDMISFSTLGVGNWRVHVTWTVDTTGDNVRGFILGSVGGSTDTGPFDLVVWSPQGPWH